MLVALCQPKVPLEQLIDTYVLLPGGVAVLKDGLRLLAIVVHDDTLDGGLRAVGPSKGLVAAGAVGGVACTARLGHNLQIVLH